MVMPLAISDHRIAQRRFKARVPQRFDPSLKSKWMLKLSDRLLCEYPISPPVTESVGVDLTVILQLSSKACDGGTFILQGLN